MDTNTSELTLPGKLLARSIQYPDRIALREKKKGIWEETTWTEYREWVESMALAFRELGIKENDHLSILSDNCREWVIGDLATQTLGARSVGIYPTNPPEDVAYILKHSQSKVVICEDQEQVDKVIEVRGETPTVEHVIVIDPKGMRNLNDDRLKTWESIERVGKELFKKESDFLKKRVSFLDPEGCCMVIYTSGTTGQPKGAMLSGRNVTVAADGVFEEVEMGPQDTLLSYLPLCHVAEKIFSLFIPLTTGSIVHFGESINTIQEDLREVSPTIFLGVPRIWEKMHATATLKMKDSSWLKKTLFQWAIQSGLKRTRKKDQDFKDRLGQFIYDLLIYRPLQERLGLRNVRFPISGAAPIGEELLEWFSAVGISISEGFGMTECSGISHVNRPWDIHIGDVGLPVGDLHCKTAEDGEILIKAPQVFLGYYNDPEKTAEAIDKDGWLHTGDIGSVDPNGRLKITGRKKEIIITAGGKNLSPEKIENVLKLSPYIKEVVAIGDRRKYIGALVQIDRDAVGDWATRRKIPYTDFPDLSSKKEVQDLIQSEIHKANNNLAQVENVRAFRLFPKELHQDDGELTATQKVRRKAIVEIWRDLIEELYP